MTTVKRSNWNKPTPKKWRDIGDAALALSAAVSGAITALPLPDGFKLIALPIVNLIGAAIKFLTKLTHEE
jgi:hypothetical protein